MRVVMLINEFYPRIGGAQKQLILLGRELQALGVEVRVLTKQLPGLPRQDAVLGLPIIRLPAPNYGSHGAKWGNLFYLASLSAWLIRNRHTYDIVHAHIVGVSGCLGVAIGNLFAKGTIVKVANSGRYSDFGRSLGRHGLLDRLFLRILYQTDAMISISSQVRADLETLNFSPAQIVDIPNGVEVEPIHKKLSEAAKSVLRQQLGALDTKACADAGSKGPLALCVASLQPKKALDVLIRAWQEVTQAVPNARLIILGEGAERAALEALIVQSQLSERVHLAGFVQNVPDYLRAADLFVLPSRAEGLSNALLEAMSAELPIVATEVGGTSDLITSGENGLLVPPDDLSALTSALIRLLQSPALRDQVAQAARQTVESRYAISSVATRYLNLYQTLSR
jgi:glycosyltransferase involved in cell wall biosynthesis